MVWRLVQIRKIVGFVRKIISPECMEKLSVNMLKFIGIWMRKATKSQREIIAKRLNEKRRRLNSCRISKQESRICDCRKCRKKTKLHMKRAILHPDLLAHLAYYLRTVTHHNPVEYKTRKTLNEGKILSEHNNRLYHQEERALQDHRDLRQQPDNVEFAWWMQKNINEQRRPCIPMPPLIIPDPPTMSDCLSTSDIPEAFELGVNPSSPQSSLCLSDYATCRDSSVEQVKKVSKTASRTKHTKADLETNEVDLKTGSASMPLGRRPNNVQNVLLASKHETMKKMKQRPVSVKTTTNHTTDRSSNCIKCSRLIWRPCKGNSR